MSRTEKKTLNKEEFQRVLNAAKYLKSVIPRLSDGYDVDMTNGKLTVKEVEVDGIGDVYTNTIGIYTLNTSKADLSIVKG